jgi:hypothetical protein
MNGEIDGKLDTNEIYFCKDCGEEWKIPKRENNDSEEAIEKLFNSFYYYFKDIKELEEMKFDPNDLSEKFGSLKEKKEAELKRIKSLWGEKDSYIRQFHVETLKQFLEKNKYYLKYGLKNIIEEWDEGHWEQNFIDWGCKFYPKPPVKVGFWKRFFGKKT